MTCRKVSQPWLLPRKGLRQQQFIDIYGNDAVRSLQAQGFASRFPLNLFFSVKIWPVTYHIYFHEVRRATCRLRIQILLTAFHTFSTIQFFFCDLQSAFLKNDRCKQCHQLQFVRYVERACLLHMLVKEDKIETTSNKQSHVLL